MSETSTGTSANPILRRPLTWLLGELLFGFGGSIFAILTILSGAAASGSSCGLTCSDSGHIVAKTAAVLLGLTVLCSVAAIVAAWRIRNPGRPTLGLVIINVIGFGGALIASALLALVSLTIFGK